MEKNIAVLPGDGIGPEVIEQALKVLNAIETKFNHKFHTQFALVGAIAIDKTGNPLPEETLDICLQSDAVLFGAIGDPKYDNDPSAPVRPEQGLLRLRKSLGLFANVRPVTTYPTLLSLSPLKEEKIKGVDFVIYRELTGGIYFGEKGRKDDTAFDHCVYSREEIARITILAFDAARLRRKKVTLVDKANVLETSRLWRDEVKRISAQYPDVELDFLFVDNAAMQIIQFPSQFDVMLTENMFGDILSDEASVITGSMGLLPSASVGAKTSLYEPIHGSYPQATGLDIANPMATILSAAMMLDSFNLHIEAEFIRESVKNLLESGYGTAELQLPHTCKCSEIGDLIASKILAR
ncbi:MAG: 3-isopropylmalate dehydrogenase [Bacteroidota bacterium]